MARGVNKVILVGNCGQDPEVKHTASGAAVANLTVATSESWKDKQTGQPQEKTEWHRVVFFGRLAEIVGEYIKKGSKVYVEGSLTTRKWQDQSGQDRYTTEIKASEMQMLDGRNESSPQQQPQQQYQQPAAPRHQAPPPQYQPQQQRPSSGPQYQQAPPPPDLDDIPY